MTPRIGIGATNVTLKLHTPDRTPSAALQATGVSPIVKLEPEAGEQVIVKGGTPPVAVGVANVTLRAVPPTSSIRMSEGQLNAMGSTAGTGLGPAAARPPHPASPPRSIQTKVARSAGVSLLEGTGTSAQGQGSAATETIKPATAPRARLARATGANHRTVGTHCVPETVKHPRGSERHPSSGEYGTLAPPRAMLLRAAQLSSLCDCFVIGSGPAGLTVALELEKANKRVLVFESGESGEVRQGFPPAITYGHLPAGWWSRHSARTLGGTSSLWGGWCTTLTDRDFNNPAAGVAWPIRRVDLLPYYRRAAPILDRDPSIVDVERPLLGGFLYRPFSVQEDTATRFAVKYNDVLESSPILHVALGCSVVGFEANARRSVVRSIQYFHHPTGRRGSVDINGSQHVVVACGGIGNAQLLLQPHPDGGTPIGNESGQVGRFLMEHPHFVEAAECVLDEDLDKAALPPAFGNAVHAVVPDDQLMAKHGLRSCSVDCQHPTADHEIAKYLSREIGKSFYHHVSTVRTEMLPSASNRVFLTGEKDDAGFHVPAVRCVFDAGDYLNGETTLHLLSEALIQQRKGRLRIINGRIYSEATGGGHLMGTTRMGTSRSASVVDRDCRVHGYGNLSVAGSSVFPTSGYANPTLTIVALALRLADKLKPR